MWLQLVLISVFAGASFRASAAPVLEDPLTWEDLRRVIARNDIRTRDQLLASLPAKFRASLKVVFVSKSTAVKGVTSKTPRLVFSDDRTGFTLTMSTSADGPDAGFIEVASPTGDHLIAEPKVIELGAHKNQRSVFIEDPYKAFAGHPTKDCRRCHSERFRYLWPGVYPAWPGVIGEQHNRRTSEIELKAIADLKDNPVIGKHLDPNFLDPRFGVSEFGENNQTFNFMIAKAHSKRIQHDLLHAAGSEPYRPLLSSIPRSFELAGDFNDVVDKLTSPAILAMVPEGRRENFRTTIGARLQKVVDRSNSFQKSVTLSDGHSLFSAIPGTYVGAPEIEYAILHYVTEDLGLPTRDWSWTLDQRAVNLNDGRFGLWKKVDWSAFSAGPSAPLSISRLPLEATVSGKHCATEFGRLPKLKGD